MGVDPLDEGFALLVEFVGIDPGLLECELHRACAALSIGMDIGDAVRVCGGSES